jgi:hypothetical protein
MARNESLAPIQVSWALPDRRALTSKAMILNVQAVSAPRRLSVARSGYYRLVQHRATLAVHRIAK